MKITIDRTRCQGLGNCEDLVPGVFQVNDEGSLDLLVEDVPSGDVDLVRRAVSGCPRTALSLSET
jgi:ferredoxin